MLGQAPADAGACPSGIGSGKMSMGKAISTLQPSADAKTEAKKAKKQASQDLSGSES